MAPKSGSTSVLMRNPIDAVIMSAMRGQCLILNGFCASQAAVQRRVIGPEPGLPHLVRIRLSSVSSCPKITPSALPSPLRGTNRCPVFGGCGAIRMKCTWRSVRLQASSKRVSILPADTVTPSYGSKTQTRIKVQTTARCRGQTTATVGKCKFELTLPSSGQQSVSRRLPLMSNVSK